MYKQQYTISHTQENVICLSSVGYSPLTLTMMAGEKHIDPVTKMSLCHCTEEDFVLSITSQKANLCTALPTQNTTENNYHLTSTKHNCTSAKCIFNWNTLVTGHQQWIVIFSQSKPFPRSN